MHVRNELHNNAESNVILYCDRSGNNMWSVDFSVLDLINSRSLAVIHVVLVRLKALEGFNRSGAPTIFVKLWFSSLITSVPTASRIINLRETIILTHSLPPYCPVCPQGLPKGY